MIPKDTTAFYNLIHAIDDQVARLGWSKERCIVYIKDRYHVRSRLAMTDEQLKHFLKVLSSMSIHATSERSIIRVGRRRKKKHI
ncbi:hypothetical protein C7B62_06655 [Pleurocapsa sp. CCALA 161]|uniref:hypothetical protein n=1 Tax=Pleurocapsa sp. CCALA 161 TaxID=2107688 RepID=UPI000D05413A|nr:hypothetical protein [Pleurocapsa sp. CCALA 161]PSB11105.1 hypothetical protein C7B62_06655 [Pleurocapsa sp. CCALA 161]